MCEKMGWTFEEYQRQPDWFINTLILKWETENSVQQQSIKK